MNKIIIDSGPLIALFDASDAYHSRAVEFMKNNKFLLITTLASITEVLHLLDFNRNAQIDFIDWVAKGGVEIYPINKDSLMRIKQLTEKYHDLPMDFAHACLVVLAEELNINTIATIDRDFSIYRIKGKKKFKTILS